MSSDVAITVNNVSKFYQIYDNPLDRLKQSFFRGRKQFFKEFKALENISFEVKKGETVGIIGRNGSGKSTLLQMICGTLTPTAGDIKISGRVAALLELGAGFNSEFTGRENVYMNATILGLTQQEIDSKYKDIVDFADIGEFVEQPVKTYSSGMYVRLAFSVVIHADPDILIVDEALAVGDAFFQAKCMVVMKKLIDSGVTLLFVSHDVGSVKALCKKAILLDGGRISVIGDTNSAVEKYYEDKVNDEQSGLSEASDKKPVINSNRVADNEIDGLSPEVIKQFQDVASFQRIQKGKAEFLNVMLINEAGAVLSMCEYGERVTLRMIARILEDLPRIGFAYHIRDKNGFDVVYSDTGIEQKEIFEPKAGSVYMFDWSFNVMLKEADYVIASMASIPVDLSIADVEVCDFVPISAQVKVVRGASLPLHGAVHWENDITCRSVDLVK